MPFPHLRPMYFCLKRLESFFLLLYSQCLNGNYMLTHLLLEDYLLYSHFHFDMKPEILLAQLLKTFP